MNNLKILLTVFIITLLNASLSAQTDLRNIEFGGKVHSNGKGIEGVAVTDGYNISLTDAKGEYKLQSNATVEFIYITLPSGYQIPVQDNSPAFYKRIEDKVKVKQWFDFSLNRSEQDDNKHVLISWADPQIAFDEEMPMLKDAAKDVTELVDRSYADRPVYGMVCGDIIAEMKNEPKFYDPIKRVLADTQIPFFYIVGNHDMDIGGRSNHYSKETYKREFGPTYYSFNRGKIHYIVLDDVFFIARSYLSIGYLEERQLNWLKQDLALIPQGSTVVVSFHIPTYSRESRRGEYNKEAITKALQNRDALYKMLKPYNAHILSGHEHYNENYVLGDNLFEHVQSSLCGLFWQAPWASDGTPLGYTVYEFDGDNVSWYFKSVGKDKNYQFNVYPIGMSREKSNAITVNVWNYDPAWKVYWYEDGKKMGEMKQYTGYDPLIYNYVVNNEANFKYKYIGAGTTEHLFFAEPKSADAKIMIEVVDRFGNVYTSPYPSEVGE